MPSVRSEDSVFIAGLKSRFGQFALEAYVFTELDELIDAQVVSQPPVVVVYHF